MRPKKKATPANIELCKIMMKMDWTGVADTYMMTAFMALFLCLWEGLLRQAALLQTNKKQIFQPKWYATIGRVHLVVPPNRQKQLVTVQSILMALTNKDSTILLDKPPVKNSAKGDPDMIPMMTAVHAPPGKEMSPGHWLTNHVLNRLIQEKDSSLKEAWNRPLFVEDGEWITERKAKSVWRLAVERAITIRDNKKPTAETVKKYTLYSNKVGKKVSMDYADSISGTETRMIGAWALVGGDAAYSRPTVNAMRKAHAATNENSINCME